MKFHSQPRRQGVALIIVMLVIVVLGVLAGGFASSMKVETKLARNSAYDADFEWLGRSGIELARYVVGQQMNVTTEPYDALCQKWAGGPLGTNDILANVSLENNELGGGKFSIKIVDLERKYNINLADSTALKQALTLVGVDPADIDSISDAILDWIDPDDDPHINGTESDYYLSLKPPYTAKNGPIDDLSELLLIRGITPEICYANNLTNRPSPANYTSPTAAVPAGNQVTYTNALVEMFTPISARYINLNTASAVVLQLIPGIDENVAQGIIRQRAGPDGVDGTEDDTPFRTVGEIINVPGITRQGAQNASRFFRVRSVTFEVTVDVEIDGRKRQMVGAIYRTDAKNVKVLYSYWK